MRRSSQFSQQRWLEVEPVYPLGPFAPLEITGVDRSGTFPTLTAKAAESETPIAKTAFHGYANASGRRTICTMDYPAWAAVDYPTLGETYGPVTGFGVLSNTSSAKHFRAIGINAEYSTALVMPLGTTSHVYGRVTETNHQAYGPVTVEIRSGSIGLRQVPYGVYPLCSQADSPAYGAYHTAPVWSPDSYNATVIAFDYFGFLNLADDRVELEYNGALDVWFVVRNIRSYIFARLIRREDDKYHFQEVIPVEVDAASGSGFGGGGGAKERWQTATHGRAGVCYQVNGQKHNCQNAAEAPIVRLWHGRPPTTDLPAVHQDYQDWFFGYDDGAEERDNAYRYKVGDTWDVNDRNANDCDDVGVVFRTVVINEPSSGGGSSG